MRPLFCALVAVASLALACPLQAETTVFEDGIWIISGPAEFDDVVVGEGALVGFVDGVIIHGDLEVENGGWCSFNNSLLEGNLKARNASIVDFFGSLIEGNVDIKRTGGPGLLGLLPLISIVDCTIEGNAKVTDNNVNSITITGKPVRWPIATETQSVDPCAEHFRQHIPGQALPIAAECFSDSRDRLRADLFRETTRWIGGGVLQYRSIQLGSRRLDAQATLIAQEIDRHRYIGQAATGK